MTFDKEELEYQAGIIQGAIDGENILYQPRKDACSYKWRNKTIGSFDFQNMQYKVKPKPIEAWVNVHTNGRMLIYKSKQEAWVGGDNSKDVKCYKFVQVLDES